MTQNEKHSVRLRHQLIKAGKIRPNGKRIDLELVALQGSINFNEDQWLIERLNYIDRITLESKAKELSFVVDTFRGQYGR